MTTTNTNIITIFDKDKSIYFGEEIDCCEESITIRNPAILGYNVDAANGSVQVSVIPVCFPESLSDESKKNGTVWHYYKQNAKFISVGNISLNPKILEHYNSIFGNDSVQ